MIYRDRLFHRRVPIGSLPSYTAITLKSDGSSKIETINNMTLKLNRTPKINTKELGVIFVLDKSGSMASISRNAIDSLNTQIANIRENSNKHGISTKISVITFNSYTTLEVDGEDINSFVDIDPISFLPNGGTALNDAVFEASAKVTTSKLWQVILITDGEENASKRFVHLSQTVEKLGKMENVTLVAWTPPGGKKVLTGLGWPANNITEWERTEKSIEQSTLKTMSGASQTFAGYSKGVTRSMSYFTPDLNVSPSLVASNLDEVTDKYNRFIVGMGGPINGVCQAFTNKPYRVGKCFYELTKKVTVQAYKDIILYEKATGKMYTGDNIRSLLRIPEGGVIELNPASSAEYQIFIRSTSWNRNILPSTWILIER
jgi:hypothetical protein